eukprot:evm.model.scf_859EXC.3 EVM.evm.TU.scf_859EXC.3   scf_859EXC:26891-27946(+)
MNGADIEAPPGRTRCFSEELDGATVHFQVIDLGRQLYVWVSAAGPKLGNLYATGSPDAGMPPVSALIAGGPGCETEGMAQRLAARFDRPVVCSFNELPNAPHLQEAIMVRLLGEIDDLLKT